MKKINVPFAIGLSILFLDTLLCFWMIYSGHLGYWQFLNEVFAVNFLILISIIMIIGLIPIFLGYTKKQFS
jgi:hypothetical protein